MKRQACASKGPSTAAGQRIPSARGLSTSCAVGRPANTAVLSSQIRDLNSGTFGFVQLARDKQTGELIACKFIERGDKVCKCLLIACLTFVCAGLHSTATPWPTWSDPLSPGWPLAYPTPCCRSQSMWNVRSSITDAWCTLTSCSSRR